MLQAICNPKLLWMFVAVGIAIGIIAAKFWLKFSEFNTDKCVQYLKDQGYNVNLYQRKYKE